MSIILLILIIFFLFSPFFRLFVTSLHKVSFYSAKDIYKFFKYKRWRECKEFGKINCATALFGGGKTLSTTMRVRRIFKSYDGLQVYNFKLNKWVTQRIIIYSNVDFNDIPYLHLTGSDDIINCHQLDEENYRDIFIFLIDEASTQFNSRHFKTNLPTELLNQILTCRHNFVSLFLTSQRFNHMDALLRQVTSSVYDCKKIWRFLRLREFDAWTLENCNNPDLIRPVSVRWLFISDSDFNAYDTYAIVENFKHEVAAGNVLSDKDVLESRLLHYSDDLSTVPGSLSFKGKRRKK